MFQRLTHVLIVLGVSGVALTGAVLALPRLRVQGHSMTPTLFPGDHLVVLGLPPAAGRLLVITDPRQPGRLMVKRCASREADGRVWVVGDNPPRSTDSRHFGPVDPDLFVGRPLYRYQPTGSAGWVLWL
ncbi:MAG: nickel-type superoxide dismutase maturation protease [Euzebya sp.]